jgi:hypothetical protein
MRAWVVASMDKVWVHCPCDVVCLACMYVFMCIYMCICVVPRGLSTVVNPVRCSPEFLPLHSNVFQHHMPGAAFCDRGPTSP